MSSKAETRTNAFTLSDSAVILVYAILFVLFWLYTGFTTTNFTTWLLENTLTLPFLVLLYYLYRWHKFSTFSITSIFIFLMLHVYGSQHTYADNPFGFWIQDVWQLERNHFDRIVHFSFGFLLAYPMHEIARCKLHLKSWLTYIMPLELTLSLGTLYELVEWAVADYIYKKQGPAFLGMQGDIWDAQKDLALALLGAAIMMTYTLLKSKSQTKPNNKKSQAL